VRKLHGQVQWQPSFVLQVRESGRKLDPRYVLEIEAMLRVQSPYFVYIHRFSLRPPYCIASELVPSGCLKNQVLNPTQNTITALGTAYGLSCFTPSASSTAT
jgi:hypothetical protein